jgi:hypothetical protein
MSTTFQPFGLKPAFHPSGLDRSVPFAGTNNFNLTSTTGGAYSAPYSLATGQAFYQYTPVAIGSAGALTIAGNTPADSKVYGSFDGVEFTDSQGRRSVAKWASKATLDASTQIIFWIFQDINLVYEAQVYGSVTSAAIGSEYNFLATAGYSPTGGYSIGNGGAGFSTTALAATPVTAGTGQGQVRVVGLGREVAFPAGQTNAWGDTYTIVQVVIANNAFTAASVSA